MANFFMKILKIFFGKYHFYSLNIFELRKFSKGLSNIEDLFLLLL